MLPRNRPHKAFGDGSKVNEPSDNCDAVPFANASVELARSATLTPPRNPRPSDSGTSAVGDTFNVSSVMTPLWLARVTEPRIVEVGTHERNKEYAAQLVTVVVAGSNARVCIIAAPAICPKFLTSSAPTAAPRLL